MADDPIKDYLADHGMREHMPDYEKFTGPTTIEEYWASQGLVSEEFKGLAAPPTAELQEKPKEEDTEESGWFYGVGQMRAPQAYGSLVRGIIDPFSAIPKQIGILSSNLFDTDPREGWGYAVGGGMDWVGEALAPDVNPDVQGEFLADHAPRAIGNMFGIVFGTRGIGGVAMASKIASRAGGRGVTVGGVNVLKGAAGTSKAAKASVAAKAAALGAKRGVPLSPTAIKAAGRKAARRDVAAMSKRYQTGTYAVVGGELGAAQAMVGGWEDAMHTLEARAQSEGRELTDEEKSMAFRSYMWNSLIGLSEVAPVFKLLKHLDGVVPRGKSRMFEALKTGGYEAAQEFSQSMYGNYVASHLVGYDKGRKLLEGAYTAAGAGGVAGAVMGLLTFTLGRRVKMHRDIEKLEADAAEFRKKGMPKNAAMLEEKAKRLRALIESYDRDSGAAEIRSREEATTTEAAPAAESAGILDPSRRFEQDLADVADPAADPAVTPVDPAIAPAVDPVVAPVDPLADPEAAPADTVVAPVDPVVAPVDPVVAPVDPEAEAVVTPEAEAELSAGWAEAESQLQKGTDKELFTEAQEADVDPSKIRRTKHGKITNKALRDAIADRRTERGRALLGAEAADKDFSLPYEGATPQDVEAELAEGGALSVLQEPEARLAEDVDKGEAEHALLEEYSPMDVEAGELAADSSSLNLPYEGATTQDVETELAEGGQRDLTEPAGPDVEVEGPEGRNFTLVSQPSGEVSVEVDSQPVLDGKQMPREEAEARIESGEFNVLHDAVKEEGGEDFVPAETQEQEPSQEQEQEPSQEQEQQQQEQEQPAAEEQSQEEQSQEPDADAERRERVNAEQRVLMPDGNLVLVIEKGVDPESPAVVAAIEKAYGAYLAGARSLGFRGNESDPIELRFKQGHTVGGPMYADPLNNINAIFVGVDNIANAPEGMFDLNGVASEEIWHVVEAQALMDDFLTNNPDATVGDFKAYFTQHYVDIYNDMTEAEVNEAISTYYTREERSGDGVASKKTLNKKEREGGEEWDRHRMTIAAEYTRIRGQQALRGKVTEQGYGNRDIAPSMHRLLKKVLNWVYKLTGRGHWVAASTSSELAYKRVEETKAMLQLLSGLANVKKVEAEAAARKKLQDTEAEGGEDYKFRIGSARGWASDAPIGANYDPDFIPKTIPNKRLPSPLAEDEEIVYKGVKSDGTPKSVINPEMPIIIYDVRGKRIVGVGKYKNKKAAKTRAEKYNQGYGAHRYSVEMYTNDWVRSHEEQIAAESVQASGSMLRSGTGGGAASTQRDAEYLRLASDPEANTSELQRMVDEAAAAAGYTIGPVPHGTTAKPFNVFRTPAYFGAGAGMYATAKSDLVSWGGKRTTVKEKPTLAGKSYSDGSIFSYEWDMTHSPDKIGEFVSFGQNGIFRFDGMDDVGSPKWTLVENWEAVWRGPEKGRDRVEVVPARKQDESPRIIQAYIRIENPAKLTATEGAALSVGRKHGRWDQGLFDKLVAKGHDGAIAPDDFGGPWNNHYIPFYPNQIKSADPITRDDAGNIIPLSQRFDDTSDSILRSGTGGGAWSAKKLSEVAENMPLGEAFWLGPKGEIIELNSGMGSARDVHERALRHYLESKGKTGKKQHDKLIQFAEEEAQVDVDNGVIDEIQDAYTEYVDALSSHFGYELDSEYITRAANRMGWIRVTESTDSKSVYFEGRPSKDQTAVFSMAANDKKMAMYREGSDGRARLWKGIDFTGSDIVEYGVLRSAIGNDISASRVARAKEILNADTPLDMRKAIEGSRPDLTSEEVTAVHNGLKLYHGTDLLGSEGIHEQGFQSGFTGGKVGGAIYLSTDNKTDPFGQPSQPRHFATNKGQGEILELIGDFNLIINGDKLALEENGELSEEAVTLFEAVADVGGLNGHNGTPREIFDSVMTVERVEGNNIGEVDPDLRNLPIWQVIGRLEQNPEYLSARLKEAANLKETKGNSNAFKRRLVEKGVDGVTFYSGVVHSGLGRNINSGYAGREIAVFRGLEESLLRNYVRDVLYLNINGKYELRSGTDSGGTITESEAPVAPVPHDRTAVGVIGRMLSPHRWALGGEDLLRRAGLHNLADSLREYYDAESILLGRFFDGYRDLQEKYTYKEWETAKSEFNDYMTIRERGPKSDEDAGNFREEAETALAGMSKATKDLVAWQKSTAQDTGALSSELDVHVYDPSLRGGKGGWRKIGDLGEWHFPRMFKQETFDIITNRNLPQYREKYRTLLNDMVANGNAETVEEAHESLQKDYRDTTGGDYFANLERARGVKLPDQYYENSVEAYLHFLRRYSERAAQIQAFGQRIDDGGKRVKDAWDIAKDEVGDASLAEDIDLIQKTVYRQRPKWEGWQNVASWGTGISSMLYLSGPLTSLRNLTSALRMNMESFGYINTAGALGKSLLQSTKATALTAQKIFGGEWTAKFWKEGAKTATPEMVAEAHAVGALRMDFQTAQLLDLYEDSPWYDSRSARAKLMKGNTMALWMHGVTERMGRSISYTAGLQWLRATRTLVENEQGDYKRRLALMKRMGFHTESDRQAVLNGDVREVQRFLRATVREKQYSYDVSQSPLFFSSPVGRMFFQFQKWGYQRLRDLGRNVISPALGGEKVYHKGRELQVERDFKPLLRMMILSMGAGELYSQLREALTDKERKEAGFGEIAETYSVDEQRAMMLAFERMANNFVLDGGSGIIGDYYQLSKDMATRGWRYKNPLEPPTIQTGKEIVGLVTDRFNRESLTEGLGRDLKDFFLRLPALKQPPLSSVTEGLMDNTIDEHWSAKKDASIQVGKLRNAARRFADEFELDEARSMNFIMDAKNPNSYLYDSIHDALLVGDHELARDLRRNAIEEAEPKERRKKLLAMRTSVRNRQPLKVGGVENEKVRRQFYLWLKERRPAEAASMMEVQRRYLKSAALAGLR